MSPGLPHACLPHILLNSFPKHYYRRYCTTVEETALIAATFIEPLTAQDCTAALTEREIHSFRGSEKLSHPTVSFSHDPSTPLCRALASQYITHGRANPWATLCSGIHQGRSEPCHHLLTSRLHGNQSPPAWLFHTLSLLSKKLIRLTSPT